MILLDAWYRFAAPPEPEARTQLRETEVVRRARINSLVILVTIWLAALPLIIQPSQETVGTLVFVLAVDLATVLIFNRRGKITVSGLIITSSTQMGIMLTILKHLHDQGYLTFQILLIMPLLILAVAVAASTTRPAIATIVFIVNCVFAVCLVLFAPKAPNLSAYLMTSEGKENIFIIPLNILQATFLTTVIWVLSANKAIMRAEEADVRTLYIQQMAAADKEALQRKQKFEEDVSEIIRCIADISQKPSKPVSVTSSNQLRFIAQALNTLRKRQMQSTFDVTRNIATQEAAQRLMFMLEADASPDNWKPSGTIVDDIVYQLRLHELRRGITYRS